MATHAILFNSDEANKMHADQDIQFSSSESAAQTGIALPMLNRLLEYLVRTKKRVVPDLRLEALPFYCRLKA